MRLAIVVGLVGVMAASAACGKSAEQKAAEQAAENARVAAEQMKKAAESAAAAGTAGGAAGAAAGVDAFAKAMAGAANAMAAKGPDGKAVEPVSFRELQTVLPEVSGWEREEPKGEKMTLPVPFSQTETRYKKGDASVEMKIVDSGFSQLLLRRTPGSSAPNTRRNRRAATRRPRRLPAIRASRSGTRTQRTVRSWSSSATASW